MDERQASTAKATLTAAYEGTMDFPSIVRALIEAGFESYTVDYRKSSACYYRADGDCLELQAPKTDGSVAPAFRADLVEKAVREAQTKAPGYTYRGFSEKVKAAGCAGYIVSFLGKRVVYFGRTGETHVEHFPQ